MLTVTNLLDDFPSIIQRWWLQHVRDSTSAIVDPNNWNANIILILALLLFAVCGLATLVVIWLRLHTKRRLLAGGLPTILWRPKFVNYRLEEAENITPHQQHHSASSFSSREQLPSSTITNILPRMKRLQGPFDMYGTVYGVSTAVVHVAHPIPAAAILCATTNSSSKSLSSSPSSRKPAKAAATVPTTKAAKMPHNSTSATKAPAYNHFENFCGQGVFTADGADWKAKRAAVLHALLLRNNPLESFEEKLQREIQAAFGKFVHHIESLPRDEQGKIKTNIVPVLQRTTIGLIYRYITDCDAEEILAPCERLGNEKANNCCSNSSSSSSLLPTYLRAITRIRMIILAQSRSIWFLLPRWIYRAFSTMFQDEEQTMEPIRLFAEQACQQALPGSPLDVLKQNPIYRGDHETGVPSKNILDEAITLLFAGQDTSAATLSWTLHLLSLYPTVQAKLASEVRSALSGVNGETDLSIIMNKRFLSKLSYLDAVIKESMRLYPVAPFIVRRLTENLTLRETSDTSVTLPKNSLACIWIYALHRNPLFWHHPDDFLPERWLEENGDAHKDVGITHGAYMPFALGLRNCVGQPLAHSILRSLLARLVNQYKFSDDRLEEGLDPTMLRKDMQAGFTVLPMGGVDLVMEPYS